MILEKLVEQLKIDEGFSSKAFWDNKQYTNGYGTEAKSKDEIIDRKEAEKRLIEAAAKALEEYQGLFGHLDIGNIRAEALSNMLYNLGLPTFLSFKKMIKAIRENNWYLAAHEAQDSRWYKQVGNRAVRICDELALGERIKE